MTGSGDELSLPALGAMLFAGMIAAAWLGNRLRARGADRDNDAEEGYLLSAVLALLGLLIAFTFSLAVSRYDARRELVVAEANAIGTAWLRAGLAEGEGGAALQSAIASYTDVRLGLSRMEAPARVEAASGKEQRLVWTQVRTLAASDRSAISAGIVAAVNEMFDSASARKAERAARIPDEVVAVLIAYAVIAAGIVGYVMGATGRRHMVVTAVLFLLLTLAITLILDLDRPLSGAVTVSQQPMYDVRESMR